MRCMHEAQTHRYNSYITLTYNEEHLPQHNSLRHRDYVLFMKALRNRLSREVKNYRLGREGSSTLLHSSYGDSPHTPGRIAFYMAGEYGEKYHRPHYHALLFGVDFADKQYHSRTQAGEKIYKSKTLEKMWSHGYSSIGAVTFNSAAYISRYVMKKRTGDGNKYDYEILDLDTGEIAIQKKEYNCMSRNPGIGKHWFTKYKDGVYTTDTVITSNGMELTPPRYYDKQLKKLDRARLQGIKLARELEAQAHAADHTTPRLLVQEEVANAKARYQTRNLQ